MLTVSIGLRSPLSRPGTPPVEYTFGLWVGDGRARLLLHQSLNCAARVRSKLKVWGEKKIQNETVGPFSSFWNKPVEGQGINRDTNELTFSWLWLWQDLVSGWRFGIKTLKGKWNYFTVSIETCSKQEPQEPLHYCINQHLCPSDWILMSNYL